MADEQKDKTEDLSAEELAQVTGGATLSTTEAFKIKETFPTTTEPNTKTGPVSWDIAANKAS